MTREEHIPYERRQVGRLTLAAMVVGMAAAWVALANVAASQGQQLWIAALALLIGVLPLLFGWLTVSVSRQDIHVRFGVGLIRRRIPIADVRSVRSVRNAWYYGWGIRLTPHGWLWNVAGLGAVELELAGGRRFRIGTDEPRELEAAIRRVVSARVAGPVA